MAVSFDISWFEEIAQITEDAEWEVATIEVRDPSLVISTYDVATNAYVQTGNPVLFTTQARGIGVRLVTGVSDTGTANPTSVKNFRWQFPHSAYTGRIKPGFQIRVIQADRNPTLLTYMFTISAEDLASSQASRSFECNVDMEVDANWQ